MENLDQVIKYAERGIMLILILYFIFKEYSREIKAREEYHEEELVPGTCECGHSRCCHEKGIGGCQVRIGPTKKDPEWGTCACQIYIFDPNADDDDDDDNDFGDDPDPSGGDVIKELERTKNGVNSI